MPPEDTGPIPSHVAKQNGWRAGRLRQLGYSSYRDYLEGDHWKFVRNGYWTDDKTSKECICGERDLRRLALHHLTYLRIGNERLTDLRPLCGQCHNDIHVLAERGLIGFDLAGYADERRSIAYAAERQLRLARSGDTADDDPSRPFSPEVWKRNAKVREYDDKIDVRGDDFRREFARRLARNARAGK